MENLEDLRKAMAATVNTTGTERPVPVVTISKNEELREALRILEQVRSSLRNSKTNELRNIQWGLEYQTRSEFQW